MSKARKGGLGRGLGSLIASPTDGPVNSPADAFIPTATDRKRGGSVRSLLVPGGGTKRGKKAAEKAKLGVESDKSKDRAVGVANEAAVANSIDGWFTGGSKGVRNAPIEASTEAGAKASTEAKSDVKPGAEFSAESGAKPVTDTNQVTDANSIPGANVSRETLSSSSKSGGRDEESVLTKKLTKEPSGVSTVDVSRETSSEDASKYVNTYPTATFAEINIKSIQPNPKQPRTIFDDDDLQELADSVKEVGVLQPIVVRPSGDRFELIMGERRWRACQRAGFETIPAIIRWTDDNDLLRDALLENLHRAQLNPLEEAAAYEQLMQEFGCSQSELAERIARSRPRITNTLRLLKLPAAVQNKVAAEVLSAGHARALLSLSTPEEMEYLADRIVNEGLSVRTVEELVAVGDIRGALTKQTKTKSTERRIVGGSGPEHERAEAISDALDTRVKVNLGAKKGRITIEFAGIDDLDRIVQIITASAHR